jgi:glucose/arabinose dehydrogenase
LRFVAALAASCLAVAAWAQRVPPDFEIVQVVDSLERPTSIRFGPDGRLYVTEQRGSVWIVGDDGLLPEPFFEVGVDDEGERGLMSVTFDDAGGFYVYYTRQDAPLNRLGYYRIHPRNPDRFDAATPETVVLDEIAAAKFHNGGSVARLPDGTLLVSTGDAEAPEAAGSLGSPNGKLLRIGPDGSVPPDNPLVDRVEAMDRIWASGLRNPFRIVADPAGERLYVNDVGRAGFEEINLGEAGADYGWPSCEGGCDREEFANPLIAYSHSQGCAITGGAVYAGTRFPPEYRGRYFFADFCGDWIRYLDASDQVQYFADELDGGLVDLALGPDGSLYYLTYDGGEIGRIRYAGEGNKTPVAVAAADPLAGSPPLAVTFDATASSDPDGDPLSFAWSFGDGSAAAEGGHAVHTYATKGPYRATVTVGDPSGATDRAHVTVMVGMPPTALILEPVPGATFAWGERVNLAGEASDPEEGPLHGDRLRWTVVLHHHPESDPNHHAHPFLSGLTGTEAGFDLAEESHAPGEFVWFRIHLVAFDSDGLSGEATVDLLPSH